MARHCNFIMDYKHKNLISWGFLLLIFSVGCIYLASSAVELLINIYLKIDSLTLSNGIDIISYLGISGFLFYLILLSIKGIPIMFDDAEEEIIKWCPTCTEFRRIKQYEDIDDGLRCSNDMLPEQYIPCQSLSQSHEVWATYFKMEQLQRALYPKNCPLWRKSQSPQPAIQESIWDKINPFFTVVGMFTVAVFIIKQLGKILGPTISAYSIVAIVIIVCLIGYFKEENQWP